MTALAGDLVALDDGQREVLAQALADAIARRDPGPPSDCADCMLEAPGTLCGDHEADLQLTDAYLQLADELGIEVDL